MRDDKNNPLFTPGKPPRYPSELYDAGFRKAFFTDYIIGKKERLTPTALELISFLMLSCHYSSAEVLYDEATFTPLMHNQTHARAILTRAGNRTPTFTYAQLSKEVGGRSQHSIRDAIETLKRLKLIRDLPPTASARSIKIGRPIELLRFEINPDYGWQGDLAVGMACLGDFDDDNDGDENLGVESPSE